MYIVLTAARDSFLRFPHKKGNSLELPLRNGASSDVEPGPSSCSCPPYRKKKTKTVPDLPVRILSPWSFGSGHAQALLQLDRKIIPRGTFPAFQQMISKAQNLPGSQSATGSIRPDLAVRNMTVAAWTVNIKHIMDANARSKNFANAPAGLYLAENDGLLGQQDLDFKLFSQRTPRF